MLKPEGLSPEELEAFTVVYARLDAGDQFEERCRSSFRFAQAIEEARTMRAFWPDRLCALVLKSKEK